MRSSNKIQGRKPNYLYAVLGVSFVLLLLGIFGLVLLQANELVSLLRENVEVIAELKADVNAIEIDEVKSFLKGSEKIKPNSVLHIDKVSAAKTMQKEFGEEFLTLDMPNPLFDVVTFKMKADYLNPVALDSLKSELKLLGPIRDVYYQESIADSIAKNMTKIGYIALGIGLLFVIISIFLIHNTIRLALYSNRFLIKNMELVGASWKFISRPYLKRSISHGFFSGVIAILSLTALHFLSIQEIPELGKLLNWNWFTIMSGVLILLGILITFFSTWFVVNKYLKMRVDEMY